MAQRDVEREYAQRIREILTRVGDFAVSEALAAANAYGIEETQAHRMVEWARRSLSRPKPDAGPQPVETVTWKDFHAQAMGEVPWLVKPYLVRQGLTLIAGEQKSGKTFFTGFLIGELLKANFTVLLVEEEGSAVMVRQRLECFIPAEADGLHIAFRRRHELTTGTGIERLIGLINTLGVQAVMLDPLIFLMDGDENDTAAMRTAMQGVIRVATETGVCIGLNHHARKATSAGRGDLTSADVRGNSTLMGAADVICLIQKREGEPGRVRFDVTCGDSRYEPFDKEECCVRLGPNGGMEFVKPKDVPERLSALAKDVYRLVPIDGSSKGVSVAQLAKAMGKRKENIVRAVQELEDRGHVARHPHSLELFRNPSAIKLPEHPGTGAEQVGNGSGNSSRSKNPSSHAVPDGNNPPLSYGEGLPEQPPSPPAPQELTPEPDPIDGFDT